MTDLLVDDTQFTCRSNLSSPRSNIDPVEYAFKGRCTHFPTEDEITQLVKRVQREKQKQKDNEQWEEHCNQNVMVSIHGSYVVKDNSYPKIVLPSNENHNSLFKSGAITITSNENVPDCVSSDEKIEEFEIVDGSSDENDIVLNLNKVNINNEKDFAGEESDQNKTEDEERNMCHSSPTQPKNIQMEKLRVLRTKIDSALTQIKESWDLDTNPDGEEDFARRKKRATEFSSRFSRNYLYNLGRQMAELRKLLKTSRSPRFININMEHEKTIQKIANAHNIILLGLNAYHKHMPSSVPGAVPDKLTDLLNHACDLWRLCNKCEFLKPILYSGIQNEIFIENIDTKCKMIMQQIREDRETNKWSNVNQLLNTQIQNMQKTPRKPAKSKTKSKKLSDKLSMYTMDTSRQSQVWRRNLNKTKSIVKQRLYNKPRKIQSDEQSEIKLEFVKASPSRDVVKLKKKRSEIILVPVKEDEIVTQMDILNEREPIDVLKEAKKDTQADAEIFKPTTITHDLLKSEFNETLRPLLLEILHNIDNTDNLDDEKQSILELKNILTEIKQVTVPKSEPDATTELKITGEKQVRRKVSRTSIIGSKNAKLICLSPIESRGCNETLPECQSIGTNTTKIESPNKKPHKKSTIRHKRVSKRKQKSMKNQRLTKMVTFSKELLQNVTNYRDNYLNYIHKNTMYVIKKNRKPWEIVSRISDGLLDCMLSEVVSELEIDNFLENLYEMEFA